MDQFYHISNHVAGSFSVLKYLIGVTTRVRRSDQDNNQDPPRPHPAQYVINCFLCAWFITGIKSDCICIL